MDGGAWWAAVYGVAQSRTLLKQLSSSRQQLKVMVFNASECSGKSHIFFWLYILFKETNLAV